MGASGGMKIDAHQHYWLLSRGDYGWLNPEAGVLFEDYMPSRLVRQLALHGIEKTIVVQAAPTIAETDFLLQLARVESSIAGVVGWMDLESETFEQSLEKIGDNPFLLGIRPSWPQDEAGRLLRSDRLIRSLQLLAERGIPIDLLLTFNQLQDAARILAEVSRLRAVVDHLGNPTFKAEDWKEWTEAMEGIAQNPRVYCKLSGMINRIAGMDEEEALGLLHPYVDHLFDCFSSSRILFGSDWPVCRLGGEYEETVHLFEKLISGRLLEQEREAVYGGNAQVFYGL